MQAARQLAAQKNAFAVSPPTPPTQIQNTKEEYRFVL